MDGEARAATAGRSLPFSAPVAIETALAATGFGVFVVWAWRDGGFAPEEWLPGGLLLLALLCTAAVSADVRRRLRARPLPLIFFGLYVAWSYVSILWAQVPADALDGANRTLVYWLIFALFSGLAISERLGEALVLAWGTAVAVLGAVALAQAANATRAAGHFVQGRLAAPISYPDGDAALFLSACLALLVLASRRQAHAALRLTACGAAVVLADLSVLSQSRGSLVWLPFALVLYLVVARNKLRAFAQLGIAAIAVAPAVPALLEVYSAVVGPHDRHGAITHAAAWIVGSTCLALAGMLVLMLFERYVTLSGRMRVFMGRTLAAVAGAAVIAALVVAAASHPLGRAERAWHDFTTNKKAAVSATPHLSSGLGTSRYDVWRIALRQFVAHPLTGVGADNFLVGYLQQRRTTETSRYPESIELRAFSETGLIGAALFLGFLSLAFVRAARAARRSRSPGLALACFMGCSYWLLHASTDWFWELPALTGAALALLAIAAARGGADLMPAAVAVTRTKVAIVAAAGLAAAAVLAVPWVSVSLIDAAVARGPGRSAYSLLDTAAKVNPWSEQPAIVKATLAADAGNRALERRAFLQALRRNPNDWYPHLMLGIVAGREHSPAVARAEFARARKLSPRDLVVLWAERRLRWGEPLTETQVNRVLRGN